MYYRLEGWSFFDLGHHLCLHGPVYTTQITTNTSEMLWVGLTTRHCQVTYLLINS